MEQFKIDGHILQPLNINAKDIMNDYLSFVNTEVSDYSFAYNFIWYSQANGYYSIINDAFCLFALQHNALSMPLPPLGRLENIEQAVDSCFQLMNQNNERFDTSKIDCVCEAVLHKETRNHIIKPQFTDYVYFANDMIQLKGTDYSSKRNAINRFEKMYPNHTIELFSPDAHGVGVMQLYEKWKTERIGDIPCEEQDSFIEGIEYEQNALKVIIDYYSKLDFLGVVLKVNNEIAGVTFGEKLPNTNTASVLIEKTDLEKIGAAQFIFREFSRILRNKYDIEFINAGDDMGFENLRKTKLSYRPARLVPKYTIYQQL